MKRTLFALLLLAALATGLLAACGPADETPQDAPTTAPEASPARPTPAGGPETYPGPTSPGTDGQNTDAQPTQAPSGYPPPTPEPPTPWAYPAVTEPTAAAPEAYPPPRPTPNEEKRFVITDARLGATEVSGTGYPNTSIKIISISQAGEELGSGRTNADRSFTIRLNRPLEDEVIGVQLGQGELLEDFLDGPGTDIPMIGLVLESVKVSP